MIFSTLNQHVSNVFSVSKLGNSAANRLIETSWNLKRSVLPGKDDHVRIIFHLSLTFSPKKRVINVSLFNLLDPTVVHDQKNMALLLFCKRKHVSFLVCVALSLHQRHGKPQVGNSHVRRRCSSPWPVGGSGATIIGYTWANDAKPGKKKQEVKHRMIHPTEFQHAAPQIPS